MYVNLDILTISSSHWNNSQFQFPTYSSSLAHCHTSFLSPQVIHLVRPYRCTGWCCFCCLQEVEVQSPPGTTIGWVKQDCSFIYPAFSIQNADGDTVLKIKGPCWTCRWCDVEFKVRSLGRSSVRFLVCLGLFLKAVSHFPFLRVSLNLEASCTSIIE